eukprot:TRINITY_DN6183_c0_g1_i1.p1 TRINITY_DN6183_c0_g1~~TRINITY_DN6183_c0_g1_i1.p1  ORF type:complete len:300 (-),score=56.12 TRINITY_DN6183_c0_g1_i1:12-839(-)
MVESMTGCHQIQFCDFGWSSRVYIAEGGRFVVKFPRTEAAKEEYKNEIAVLRLVENCDLNIRVPKILWNSSANEYIGYQGIVGERYDSISEKVDGDVKRRIGKQLGEFLKKLHSLEVDGGRTVSIQDEIKDFQSKYRLALSVIQRDFSEEEQEKIRNLVFVEMPNEMERLGGEMKLCHGDLGYWNMILDDKGNIGVIDFGDAGYWDKSKDFIGMSDGETLDEAIKVYGDNEILRQKVAIRQKVLLLLDLPFFIGKGDKLGIQRTVAKIRSIIGSL